MTVSVTQLSPKVTRAKAPRETRPVKTLGSSGDSVNSAANTLRYPQLQHFHWPGQSERLLLVAKGISCCFACKGLLSGRFMLQAACHGTLFTLPVRQPFGCWVLLLDRGHLAWLLCSLLAMLKELYVIPGIEPVLIICKAYLLCYQLYSLSPPKQFNFPSPTYIYLTSI